jgi:dipeptidyl-peptidase-4
MMRSVRSCCPIAVALLLLASPAALAQGLLQDYQRAEQFLPGNVRHLVYVADVSPHWIGKTDGFWYRRVGLKDTQFIVVDAERNTSVPAFDHTRLAAALSRADKQEYSPSDLPFHEFEFVEDGKAIRFSAGSAEWTCSLISYDCKNKPGDTGHPNEQLSPNKRWAAFVRDHNLFLRDVSTGTEMQLTRDGIAGCDYATPLPSLRLMVDQGTEDVKQSAAVFWAPDSSKLVTYRIDSRSSGRFTSLQFVPPNQLRPKAFTYVYPLPGEVLAKAEPIIFEIQSGRRIDVKSAPIELPFQEGPGFEWFPDSKSLYYDYDERGYKGKELRVVDASTGEQKVLIREQSDTYIDPGETFYRFVKGTGEILWGSERDGWDHLYLYSKTGQLENQITQGHWVVQKIEYVDEPNRRVYFSASGREKDEDPYQTHLYSVAFDGKGLQLLTPENATHSINLSPDGAYFIDSYSRPDLPDKIVMRRTKDGSEVRVLEQTDSSPLTQMGWRAPESFHGKASDGTTDLYGLIWRPSKFDTARKYPVVEFVYAGPQSFFVPKTFGTFWLQSMAELGFVVVMIDGRGTAGRSRAFREFSYRNLGGAFEDHVAMIKQMTSRYPYMDTERVGVFGTSAGGYGAAHAMLAFPDFYKVGVSTSGDHDARLDKAWWNELYQGYPVQDDYAQQSNVTMASRLKVRHLMEHGDVDDNVHPVETMRLADALMKANKDFDMLLVPNMFHGESGDHALYLVRRRWDYFVRYLLGVMPPAGFEIKEDREGISSRRRRRR